MNPDKLTKLQNQVRIGGKVSVDNALLQHFHNLPNITSRIALVLYLETGILWCSHLQGTPRRKKKVVHKTATTDDKRLQTSLKKLAVNTIPGIEEVIPFDQPG